MKRKFYNIKNIVIVCVSLILICMLAIGIAIFVKNGSNVKTIGKNKQVQSSLVINNIDSYEIPEVSKNVVNEIEESVIKERQKVFENLELSWTAIKIATKIGETSIYKPELQIEKKATEIIRDGTDDLISVDPNNKPVVKTGDSVIFTIKVSNIGNYKTTNVIVTDSLTVIFEDKEVEANNELTKIETLDAGETKILKVEYVVTQKDMETFEEVEGEKVLKNIVNVATATDGRTTVKDEDDIPVDSNKIKPVCGTITMNWDVESTTDSPVPVDVVFILDTSKSMVDNGSQRGQNMINAVNKAIKEILGYNENNRVSVVGYSEYNILSPLGVNYNNNSHASVLLSLDRYTAKSNNDYLYKDGNKVKTNVSEANDTVRYFEAGTYTQAGIELGAKQLINSSEKIVNIDGKDVQRVPVIILLSDGEPTVFSTNYQTPISGKILGTSQLKNTSAVYGYYTILTANYYKQMVKAAYNNTPVKEFTIAMDLTTHYGETVLNPNSTNIEKCLFYTESSLNNDIENREISQDLYNYLNLTQNKEVNCSVGFIQEVNGTYKNEPQYNNINVISNPYSNYSYADKAFAGSMNTEDLQQAMIGSITETISNKITHNIDENDRALGKVYLDKIDITKGFTLEIKDEKIYTSYNDAEKDGYVVLEGERYFVDLTKLQGKTVIINYRQK